MPKHTVYIGNTLDVLKQLPDESVDCIITSPPYWSLRDYGEETNTVWGGNPDCEHEFELNHIYREPSQTGIISDKAKIGQGYRNYKTGFCKKCGAWYGQLGLEPELDMYIEHMLQITKELKRVLKKTGVMFWNHGDSYSGNMGKRSGWSYVSGLGNVKDGTAIHFKGEYTLPQKCLCLQNYRLILRMIDEQGWILRNVVIWYKPNGMPSSVKDRFANKYEPVFMFVKTNKPQYYYNIKIGVMSNKKVSIKEGKEDIDWEYDTEFDRNTGKFVKTNRKVTLWRSIDYWFDLDAVRVPHKTNGKLWDEVKQKIDKRWKEPLAKKYYEEVNKTGHYGEKLPFEAWRDVRHPLGKNPGDVWEIPTEPFPESHFATFPQKLVEPMIKAGCPQWICKKCGKARVRITKKEYYYECPSAREEKSMKERGLKIAKNKDVNFSSMVSHKRLKEVKTIGWTDCGCNTGWRPRRGAGPFCWQWHHYACC